MLRPSHFIALSIQPHQTSRRATALGVVIALQAVLIWGFASGLAEHVIQSFRPPIDVARIEPVKPASLPPPMPRTLQPVMPSVVAPIVTIDQGAGDGAITATVTPLLTVTPKASGNGEVPDHAAIGIKATHTQPPYPALAERLGSEGKVTLRLTVLADGTVGDAQIVKSSGRTDLDRSAQQWIPGRWIYKPALKDGAAVASQALVTIVFNLNTAP